MKRQEPGVLIVPEWSPRAQDPRLWLVVVPGYLEVEPIEQG